jgi:hypothetical protein
MTEVTVVVMAIFSVTLQLLLLGWHLSNITAALREIAKGRTDPRFKDVREGEKA